MSVSARNFLSSTFFAWIVVAVLGLYYLFTIGTGGFSLRPNRLKFGIDLVGGTYITLEVQTDKAIEAELGDRLQAFTKKLKASKKTAPSSKTVKDLKLIMRFDSTGEANEALTTLSNVDPELKLSLDGTNLIGIFKDPILNRIRENAVQGNIEVLRTRLDGLGVGEITIAAQGDKNIVVELPNVDDPQHAKAMIGKAALLEIKLVEQVAASQEDLLDEFDGELPEDMEILPGKEEGVSERRLYYLVPKFTDITGRLLKDAYTGFGGGESAGEIVVHFKFNPTGGEKFYELTKRNPGRQVAIILDGIVISAPKVSTPIGAEGYIHGNFTQESGKELSTLLKSGAFIAPVTFEEERQIGPSLGRESIDKGLLACLVGLGTLLVFSVAIYKLSGFYAFLTLLYNLLVILLCLSWLGATLTLPGIAGMVLTMGMAIDASILIYEKIREELMAGTTPRKAVDVGFSDAMTVILDSNITTLLVGLVLYLYGTGPIQGFAVTMMIGIISTLITGLFFLRSLFTATFTFFGVQKVSI